MITLPPTRKQEGHTALWRSVRFVINSQRQALPLQPVPRASSLPLSFAQERMLLLHQLKPNSLTYNEFIIQRLKGTPNISALEKSLNEIIRRHEVLRTTFTVVDGQAFQHITPPPNLRLLVIDLQNIPEPEQESETYRLVHKEIEQPFNLTQGPLLRTHLLHLGTEDYVLLITTHQICFDDQSKGIFIQELMAFYETFSTNKTLSLPELPIQYADFAYWQRQWFKGGILETQLAYWKKQLGTNVPQLRLSTHQKPLGTQSSIAASQTLEIPTHLYESLKTLSQQEGVTLFVILLAAFQTLLYHYTMQEDILVFSSTGGRNRAEIKGLIGLFANILALRTNLSGNPSFRELLGSVQETALGAYTHQDLPFNKLVEIIHSTSNHAPLFQVLFVLQNALIPKLEFSNLKVEPFKIDNDKTTFDLILYFKETAQGLTAWLKYKKDLFDTLMMIEMLAHFQTLLENIIANPNQQLSKLLSLTETDRQQLPIFRKHNPFVSELNTTYFEKDYQAPRNTLELELTKIWKRIFKTNYVSIHDNFFDLGGYSLLAITLLDQIEKHFGKSLPVTKIFQAPTIAQQANILRKENYTTPWRALEIVQSQGTRIPFFFVGAISNAHALARVLGTYQPLYVLNIFSLSALNNITLSIDIKEIAKQFIKEIQTVQPQGPYCLGGFCGDFKLTLEIALQLQSHGQEVALLVSFDGSINRYKSHTQNQRRSGIYRHWKNFLEMGPNYLSYKIRTKLKHLVTLLRDFDMNIRQHLGIKLNKWMQAHQFIKAFRGAEAKHIPNYYSGTITLFLTNGNYLRHSNELARLVANKVEVYEVPGEHDNLFISPQVEILGEQLKQCLEKAQAQGSDLSHS